jgi:hypothetical protein
MIGAVVVALFIGAGTYWAAERSGRSPELWLLIGIGIVLTGYVAMYFVAGTLSTSNDIFTAGGRAGAIAEILAGPLVGIGVGNLVIAWLLRTPAKPLLSAPIHMFRDDGDEMIDVSVRFEPRALVVTREGEEQRIEVDATERADVDGVFLVVHVGVDARPLRLRPSGAAARDRTRSVALVELMARRLRESCARADA